MTQQRSQAGSEPDSLSRVEIRRSVARVAARTLRRPGTSLAALTLGILAIGAVGVGAVRVSSTQTADVLESLSATWAQLLSAAHLRAAPEHAMTLIQPRPDNVPAAAVAVAPPPVTQNAIVYGDRLKITFFESIGVPIDNSARKPGAASVTTVFPRMDLTGEYTVDEAGGVDIPRLGRLDAAGHDVGVLEFQLASAFQRALGRPSDVHVAILDRQPIYVLGGARGGATVKHAPGMIVLQALAEAGGSGRNAWDASRSIETIRETQRLGEAQDRLARALLRQAQLIALRDGRSVVAVPPATASQLAGLLPPDVVTALMQEAETTLAIDRQAYIEQIALAERRVTIAKAELAAQTLRVTQARSLAQTKAARLHDLQGIAAHGSVSQFKVADAAVEAAEGTAKQEDLLVAAAQAESRLAEAEIARAKVVQAHTTQVAASLAAAAQDVRDLRRSVASMQAAIEVLGGGMPSQRGGQAASPALRIVRRGAGGPLFIAATGTTPLVPGDVLQIDPTDPAARPIASSIHP